MNGFAAASRIADALSTNEVTCTSRSIAALARYRCQRLRANVNRPA